MYPMDGAAEHNGALDQDSLLGLLPHVVGPVLVGWQAPRGMGAPAMSAHMCQHCHEKPVLRARGKYCSTTCGHLSQIKPRGYCVWCGVALKRTASRYCSRSCFGQATSENRSTIKRKKCPWCQQMFSPRRPQVRFCSRSCSQWTRSVTADPAQMAALAYKARLAREVKREAEWETKTAGMSPAQAARWAYRKGYHAGYVAGRQRAKERAA
jgi:hypothetical protein